jgi:transposase
MRYELRDYGWTAIKLMLPNKRRGVRRLNDRRVLSGILRFCVQVHHGAICQRHMVPARLATLASFGGGGLPHLNTPGSAQRSVRTRRRTA